jgi:hypothetical protein
LGNKVKFIQTLLKYDITWRKQLLGSSFCSSFADPLPPFILDPKVRAGGYVMPRDGPVGYRSAAHIVEGE